jgi:hypothetical protein
MLTTLPSYLFPGRPYDGQIVVVQGRQFRFVLSIPAWLLEGPWPGGGGGAITANLNMNDFRIVDLHPGSGPNDATTVQQVTDLIQEALEGGVTRYVHHQPTPATVWNVHHDLSWQYVAVQVVDALGNTVVPNPEFLNASDVRLHFDLPVAGTAIIRR